MSKPTEAEIAKFLEEVKASGITNMFGAGTFLEDHFHMNEQQARKALARWINAERLKTPVK